MFRRRSLVRTRGRARFLLFVLIAILWNLQPLHAAQVMLAWDPGPEINLQGYRIYYGTTSRNYQLLADMGKNTSCNVDNLQDGLTYYFAATAYSSDAESDFSNEVVFQPVKNVNHTITASATQGGSISPSGGLAVADGGTQVFSISANAGYTIAEVTVDGVSQGRIGSYTFTDVKGNHSIQADFTTAAFALTVNRSGTGSGTVTINPSGSSFTSGTVVTLTASPASSSVFSGWSGACSGTSITCSLAMTANMTATASFQASTFTITTSVNKGGLISPGTAKVIYGSSKTYSIIPDPGYSISDVKVDGVSLGKITFYTFSEVKADHRIQANFGKKK